MLSIRQQPERAKIATGGKEKGMSKRKSYADWGRERENSANKKIKTD